jgi:chaperonin GroEL
VEEGIVPGGGVAFLRAMRALEGEKFPGEMKMGADLVKRALEEPLRQISDNAGMEGSVVIQKVKDGKGSFGYNAESGKYEDLLQAGVIDPTKVTRFALQNAASVSGLLLTTEAMVADKPDSEDEGVVPEMPTDDMY